MANDRLQDDDLVKHLLADQTRMESERAPWESQWREIEERVSPESAGGFSSATPGTRRGGQNFDVTAGEGLDRFTAAMKAITTPQRMQYIRLSFADKDLDKLPAVRRWCERAADRLHKMRYRPNAGFGVSVDKDFRQLGTFGTGPMWTDAKPAIGLFYTALPLHQVYIDEDYGGRVDTVHRKFKLTARQCRQMFGEDALTPKMRDVLKDNRGHIEFDLLHVVRPNIDMVDDALDRRGMPIDSLYIALDEKIVLRRSGYHSMPISVSRHVTNAGDKYGRSPAMKVFPTILGVNAMAQTNLRAAHKMVDPALAFYDDDGALSSISTKPGGMNPGLMSPDGRLLVAALPTGSNLPIGIDMQERERSVIRSAFLEEYFKILTDPSDRMTATQVLETMSKQGALVAPYAERYESEKQDPVTQRDLDLGMRARQVEPFPPEVLEAGGYPSVGYENPLSRMARADEAAGLTRLVETLAPLAQADPSVFDVINVEAAAPGVADVLGVRSSWIRTADEIKAKRASDNAAKVEQQGVEQLGQVADAYKTLAQGNQIAEAA